MKHSSLTMSEKILVEKCFVAKNPVSRFLGLMGKKGIAVDEAVCFPYCNSIHTFFMRFPIDVILVGKGGEVKAIVNAMAPWRFLAPKRGVKHVIEMRANLSKELGIEIGSQLHCDGVLD